MHPLTLIFGIVLLPQAYTLKCYECVSGASGTCTDTEKQCPSSADQCGALKITSYAGDLKVAEVNMKTCTLAEQCVEGSVNYGVSRSVITSTCCNSDLCNTHFAPEPSKSNPNGKKCYHCNGLECTGILNCMGNEDYCIKQAVNVEGVETILKGCASKQICAVTQDLQVKAHIAGEISCCQGDYCNSASGTSAGLLLLVAPLVSLAMSS